MVMAEAARQMLDDIGVDSSRMSLQWASAAEAPRFVELITGYVSDIKSKGALGTGENEADASTLRRRLDAAVKAAAGRKPRTAFGMLAKKLGKDNDYSPEAIAKGVKAKVIPGFRALRIAEEVKLCLEEKGGLDAADLCSMTGASSEEMDKALADLAKKKHVSEDNGRWSLV
jgi:hypothetical protein